MFIGGDRWKIWMINSLTAYKIYSGVFSLAECLTIEEIGKANKKKIGKVAEKGVGEPEVTNHIIRKSDIYFFAENWIARRIQETVINANVAAGWNLQVSDLEPFQFAEYGLGGFYEWHHDSLGGPFEKKGRLTGKVRKLSMSVLINDASEFDGGEFEVAIGYRRNEICTEVVELKSPGDVVVFPSVLDHRVRPITRGVRKSLGCWGAGPPFT